MTSPLRPRHPDGPPRRARQRVAEGWAPARHPRNRLAPNAMPSKRKQMLQKKREAKKARVTRPSGNSRYGQKAAAARKGEFSPGSPFRVGEAEAATPQAGAATP